MLLFWKIFPLLLFFSFSLNFRLQSGNCFLLARVVPHQPGVCVCVCVYIYIYIYIYIHVLPQQHEMKLAALLTVEEGASDSWVFSSNSVILILRCTMKSPWIFRTPRPYSRPAGSLGRYQTWGSHVQQGGSRHLSGLRWVFTRVWLVGWLIMCSCSW